MLSPLERIKQRVLRKEGKFDLMYWADIFLHEYGINFQDFKKLKIPTFWVLRDKIIKRYEEQEKKLKRRKK